MYILLYVHIYLCILSTYIYVYIYMSCVLVLLSQCSSMWLCFCVLWRCLSKYILYIETSNAIARRNTDTCMYLYPPTNGGRLREFYHGFLPQLHEFYFTTAGNKILANCMFRISSMTVSFKYTPGCVLPLLFSTGPSNFLKL